MQGNYLINKLSSSPSASMSPPQCVLLLCTIATIVTANYRSYGNGHHNSPNREADFIAVGEVDSTVNVIIVIVIVIIA